jgi:voltage-gated potassium channel
MTRKRIFEIIDMNEQHDAISRAFTMFMVSLIFVNVIAVVLETVEDIEVRYGTFFAGFEIFSVIVFSIEYGLRVWSCVEDRNARYQAAVEGRLRYMVSPMAIIDLLAILPFYLSMIFVVDLRFLRVFRLLRILKLTRYSGAMDTLLVVFERERRPLFAAVTIMLTLLVFLSGIMYFLEKDAQPEAFASIPHAMWWGMATLTTVGYGDVVPATVWGKFVGAFVTLLGLGMFALPAAILASGFTREAKQRDLVITWNLVAKVPLFSNLKALDIAEISDLLRPRVAAPKEVILRQGDHADAMYFIASGKVEVALGQGPVILSQGDHFGEVALLYDKPRIADVTALTSCQLLVLNNTDLDDLLDRHPTLKKNLMKIAKRRLASND